MTEKLSRPQLDALRYAKNRQLYAADINEGNGNRRRTLLWLTDEPAEHQVVKGRAPEHSAE